MVSKWLRISYLSREAWVAPIWAVARRQDPQLKVPPELGQLALHISTRLSMLPTAYRRINEGYSRLLELVKEREPHHEFTDADDAYAFEVPDELTYEVLLDVDSVLFELNACCELMSAFVEEVYDLAGRTVPVKPVGRLIQRILEEAGQETEWFVSLDDHRNFFIHRGSPYLAVDLTNADSGSFDLLITKENPRSFGDEQRFVRLSEIGRIVRGFHQSMPIIQRHLQELFRRT